MTWSELHALARNTAAKAMKDESVTADALQVALEILRIGMVTPKEIKETLK